MSNQDKITMLEEIMDVEEGMLSLDMRLEDIEEWDSLSILALTVEVKKEFGKVLTNDIIQKFETVQDILDIMD